MKKTALLLVLVSLMMTSYCQSKDKIFTTIVKFNQGIQFGDNTIQTTAAGGTGSMVYPGVGLAVSTGTAWGTSVPNNSALWNTAYSWGNHAGLYKSISYLPAWAEITGKPSTYPPASHNHDGIYKYIDYAPTWEEVTGKPTFANVAFSGDYNDLVNKPETEDLETAIPQLPGIRIPVLTSSQIATTTPYKGLLLYNDTEGVLQIYNGSVWKVLMTNQ